MIIARQTLFRRVSSQLRRRRSEDEQGLAFLELAITLPFLAFFLIGMLHLGTAAFDYLMLHQIAREAARLGSTLDHMKKDPWLRYNNPGAFDPKDFAEHLYVHERAWLLMHAQKLDRVFDMNDLQMRSELQTGGGIAWVDFSIETTFQGYEGMALTSLHIPVSVTVRAPYLANKYLGQGTAGQDPLSDILDPILCNCFSCTDPLPYDDCS